MVVLIPIIIVVSTLMTILRGCCISVLWAWFLVPLGLQAIGTAHAIGISCLVGVFTLGLAIDKVEGDNNMERGIVRVLGGLGGYAIIMFIAWIVHSWFM